MNNTHIVFCDGGLSNRLNTLLFALLLKEKYGHNWEISWPINNWCGADFNSLFSINLNINKLTLNDYKEKQNNFTLLLHENQIEFDESLIYYHKDIESYEKYLYFLNGDKPIFYFHNLIPACADLGDIKMGMQSLRINPEIESLAINFCNKNNINDSVFGLHIRKTDFGNLVDDEALYDLVLNSPHRFFVCSDDENVNDRFSKLKNCSVFNKKCFPEKSVLNSSWNSATVDDQGRTFNFNIKRSEESIVEALVDLMILSKTTHVDTSSSTFLRMSMLFKATNYF